MIWGFTEYITKIDKWKESIGNMQCDVIYPGLIIFELQTTSLNIETNKFNNQNCWKSGNILLLKHDWQQKRWFVHNKLTALSWSREFRIYQNFWLAKYENGKFHSFARSFYGVWLLYIWDGMKAGIRERNGHILLRFITLDLTTRIFN